jgi:predicted DNA-binding transcriptional regulator AlpA
MAAPLPPVCFVEDVCEALRMSRRTFEKLLRHGAFPIPEILPRLDRRHRFSGSAVQAFIDCNTDQHGQQVNRPRVGRRGHA